LPGRLAHNEYLFILMNKHACNFPAMSIPYFVIILIPDREESHPSGV
jgi:hypothetical protein